MKLPKKTRRLLVVVVVIVANTGERFSRSARFNFIPDKPYGFEFLFFHKWVCTVKMVFRREIFYSEKNNKINFLGRGGNLISKSVSSIRRIKSSLISCWIQPIRRNERDVIESCRLKVERNTVF